MRAPRLLLGILCLSAACGGNDSSPDARPRPDAAIPIDAPGPDAGGAVLPEDLPSPLPSGPVTASIMTFNVGLLQTVAGRLERLPYIIDAVKASNVDIVCLQEVFYSYVDESDPDTYIEPPAVAAALSDTYPYAAWDWTGESSYRNGLMIVSKVPLYRQRFQRYTMNDGNQIVDRALLAATAVDDTWHLNVLCTHLQAGLDVNNTTTRRDEVRELDEVAEAEGYNDGPSILLGDFNAGPDPDPLDDECPGQGSCPSTCSVVDTETIDSVATTYGWTDPSTALAFTPCTYCKAEADALAYPIALFPCEGSQRIDHCFTRNLGTAQVVTMDRVMDTALTPPLSTTQGDVNHLSDHFAVQCDIDVP